MPPDYLRLVDGVQADAAVENRSRQSLTDLGCHCGSGASCTTCAAWRRVWRRVYAGNPSIQARSMSRGQAMPPVQRSESLANAACHCRGAGWCQTCSAYSRILRDAVGRSSRFSWRSS